MASIDSRIDLHVKVLDDRVVRRAKQRGLDGIVYAPHFTPLPAIEAQARRFSDGDLTVYPAREVFTGTWRRRRHLLAIDLASPIPDFITLEGAMEELLAQEAAILVPHPTFFTVSLGTEEVERFADVIDAVEVFNPKYLPRHARRSRSLSAELGIPPFASSYAHLRGTVGESWTEFAEPFENVGDLGAYLRASGDRTVDRRRSARHYLRRVAEFSHLGWENSWEKLDRVLLSQREPTHPDAPLYDGRFDDIACY